MQLSNVNHSAAHELNFVGVKYSQTKISEKTKISQ